MENTFDDDDDDDDLHLHLHLPQDVLIQILILLPVISLLRFKSVCKSWYALIQSSLFIDLHLNTNSNNNNNNNFGTFIFQTFQSSHDAGKSEAYMLSGGGGEVKLEDLGFPPRYKVSQGFHPILMVGTCNGITCIHDTKRSEVSLWNPATRQFRLLPKSLTIPGTENLDQDFGISPDFIGFGYDVKTKDYKVVQISHFRPYNSGNRWLSFNEYIFGVQVYSLSRDSWRILEGINSLPAHPSKNGLYLNGSCYFLGDYNFEDRIHRMILSFDFTKEIFTTILLPYDSHICTIVTYLAEKLAVFAITRTRTRTGQKQDESDFKFYEIWVLKESWTKLHSTVPYFYGMPRGISNNGEFAFIATLNHSEINGVNVCSLKLFNLVTKEVKKEFPIDDKVIGGDVYKPSLVSIGRNNTNTVADRIG